MNKYLIIVTGEDEFGDPETHYYIELDIPNFDKCIDSYLMVYDVLGLKDVKVKIERIETTRNVAFGYKD